METCVGEWSGAVLRRWIGGQGSVRAFGLGPALLRHGERLARAAQVHGHGEPDHAVTRLRRVANGLWLAGLRILQGRGIPDGYRARRGAQAVEEQLQVAKDETVEARATGARKRPGEMRHDNHQVTDGDVGSQLPRALGTFHDGADRSLHLFDLVDDRGVLTVENVGEQWARGTDPLIHCFEDEAAERGEGVRLLRATSSSGTSEPSSTIASRAAATIRSRFRVASARSRTVRSGTAVSMSSSTGGLPSVSWSGTGEARRGNGSSVPVSGHHTKRGPDPRIFHGVRVIRTTRRRVPRRVCSAGHGNFIQGSGHTHAMNATTWLSEEKQVTWSASARGAEAPWLR